MYTFKLTNLQSDVIFSPWGRKENLIEHKGLPTFTHGVGFKRFFKLFHDNFPDFPKGITSWKPD